MKSSVPAKIDFVEASRLEPLFRRLSRRCTSVDMAVAFLSQEGFGIIKPTLTEMLDSGHSVRMVIGLSDHLRITDKGAVGGLISLRNRYGNSLLKLKSYNNPGFHPKLIIFRYGKRMETIIGSSNLTKGGQRDNTEANVCVAHPPSAFKASVEDFYRRVWRYGKRLTRKRLGQYGGRPKFAEPKPGGNSGNPLDELPPTANLPAMTRMPNCRKWWKIAPGYQGEVWLDDWYANIRNDKGIVSIGWHEVGDLRKFEEDLERLRTKVERVARNEKWKTDSGRPVWSSPKAIGRVTHTLANFAGWGENPVKKGDGVIAYSNESVFAIGKIIGHYRYRKEAEWYNHCRNIRWYRFIKTPPRAPQRIVDYLGRYNTLMHIDSNPVVDSAWHLPQWR